MSYKKIDPQPEGLRPGETAVRLDTGETIAVAVEAIPQVNNAPSFVRATARDLNTTASVEYRHTPTPAQTNDQARLLAIQKHCLMAVLGEPLTGPLADPIHANAIANVSIRNRIAALAAAGPVDAGALL